MNLKDTSPYAEINKEQLAYGAGMKSKAYGVKLKSFNKDYVPNWHEVGIVSSDYLLVPNKTMVQMADDVMSGSDFTFEEEKEFWNGKQFFKSWK